MGPDHPFAVRDAPRSPADCYFYHTVDLPGYGVLHGDWDLRPNIQRYLGGANVAGTRVLDVGAANGFLTFQMERDGAEVVSYDLSPEFAADVAPSRYGYRRHADDHRHLMAGINNGYWLAHHALGSHASMAYGTVYRIPRAIGTVNVAVVGCLLLHVRDPLLALQNILRLTSDKVVVVELVGPVRERKLMGLLGRLAGPYMVFAPDYRSDQPQGTWWRFTPAIIHEFLKALGFEKTTISYHEQLLKGRMQSLFTIVAERTQPMEDFGLDA